MLGAGSMANYCIADAQRRETKVAPNNLETAKEQGVTTRASDSGGHSRKKPPAQKQLVVALIKCTGRP